MSETNIELPESLTIHRIEDIFGDLKVSFNSDVEKINLLASKVDTIDTSGLQALLRLISDASAKGKQIIWQSPSENLVQSAKQIGLEAKLLLN